MTWKNSIVAAFLVVMLTSGFLVVTQNDTSFTATAGEKYGYMVTAGALVALRVAPEFTWFR